MRKLMMILGALVVVAIPAQPAVAQSSLLQTFSFVTTFDRDGAGGTAPPITRMHERTALLIPLLPNTTYALDLDGILFPVPSLPLLPGYELNARVDVAPKSSGGFDTERPKITFTKRVSANLPLRIEALTGNSTAWKSLGYDTLASGAPQSFVAAADTSNRDNNVNTDQAFLDARIAGPRTGLGASLAIVSEQFAGDPAGTRSNREITRLRYSDIDSGDATRIPGHVTADATSPSEVAGAPPRQRLILTRDARTKLDFEQSRPGASTTGTIEELPARVEVKTVEDANVNGDDKLDTTVDYWATSVARDVELHSQNGRERTDIEVDDLPMEAHLTLASPTDGTELTYTSSGVATRAHVNSITHVAHPLPDLKRVTANIERVPTSVTLTRSPVFSAGLESEKLGERIAYHANSRATRATIETRHGVAELDATITDLPTDIDRLTYTNTAGAVGGFELDYAASHAVTDLAVRTKDLLEDEPVLDPQARVLPGTGHVREISTAVTALPASLNFHVRKNGSVGYSASDVIGDVRIIGSDEQPFFRRATEIDVRLDDLPRAAEAAFKADHYSFDAFGDMFGEIEVLASDGSGQRLPATLDGARLRDTAAEFSIFARLKGLRSLAYDKPAEGQMKLGLDALSPVGQPVKVDSVRDVSKELYHDIAPVPGGHDIENHMREGTETVQASLSNLPPEITLTAVKHKGDLRAEYSGGGGADLLTFNRTAVFRGDPIRVTIEDPYVAARLQDFYPVSDFSERQDLQLTGVPLSLKICRVEKGNACTVDVFQPWMFEDYRSEAALAAANAGSLRLQAHPRTKLSYGEVKTEKESFRWARDMDAAPECTTDRTFEWLKVAIVCSGFAYKPLEVKTVLDVDVREYALQSHSGQSGAVGRALGYSDQGYLAMDTGWARDSGGLHDMCLKGFCLPPPPREAQLTGEISKTSDVDTPSERFTWIDDFVGIARSEKDTVLTFGPLFGANDRVFEGDPDEVILAKHFNGIVYCGPGFDVVQGEKSSRELFCEGLEPLPPA